MFDTHAYVKKLTAAGGSEQQAEVHAEVLADVLDSHFATKPDLAEVNHSIQELAGATQRAPLSRGPQGRSGERRRGAGLAVTHSAGAPLRRSVRTPAAPRSTPEGMCHCKTRRSLAKSA